MIDTSLYYKRFRQSRDKLARTGCQFLPVLEHVDHLITGSVAESLSLVAIEMKHTNTWHLHTATHDERKSESGTLSALTLHAMFCKVHE